MKFLLLIALAFAAWLFWKKFNAPAVRRDEQGSGRAPARALPRKALDEAQQAMYARLQAALPSTMVLVQPALGQIVDTGADASRFADVLVDFAVCSKDSTPIGVVVLDDRVDSAVEGAVTAAGLRFARFSSAHLPDTQAIKDALGFL